MNENNRDPNQRSPWIHELKWPDIEQHLKSDTVALVPIGATEQHGFHMPLMVDTCWSIVVSEDAAKEAGALISPPLHFGWSIHHMAFAGGITLRPETLTSVSLDVGLSLVYHGFDRIIYVNGNRNANLAPIEIAANQLRLKTGARVAVVDVGLLAKHEIREICTSAPGGLGHAGESETAMMLYRYPDMVDMDKAVAVSPQRKEFIGNLVTDPLTDGPSVGEPHHPAVYRESSLPSGVMGDAKQATADKGERIVRALTANLVRYIENVRALEVRIYDRPLPI